MNDASHLPSFTLTAQDPLAPGVVRVWAERLRLQNIRVVADGKKPPVWTSEEAHIRYARAIQCAQAMEAWQGSKSTR